MASPGEPYLNHARLLICAGLVLSSLAFIPSTQAIVEPTTWAAASLAGLTGAVTVTNTEIDQVGDTEGLGLLWVSGAAAHFARCNSDCNQATNWVVKNADATGAFVATLHGLVTWAGDDNWIIAFENGNVGGNGVYDSWYSTDDGATWTGGLANFSCNGDNCNLTDLDGPGTNCVADLLLYSRFSLTTNSVNYAHTTDCGASWVNLQLVSDNKGFAAGTQRITSAGGSLDYIDSENPSAIRVGFYGTADNKLYTVETTDGIYWTVPYTAEAGSTPDPKTLTNCPSDTTTSDTVPVGIAGDLITLPRKNGAGNKYECTYNISTAATDAYPSSSPATANENPTLTRQHWLDTNGVQYISAIREGTTNKVLYRATASNSWTSVYTVAADTLQFGVEVTPTKAYFIYVTSAGRLEIAAANMEAPVSPTQPYWCSNPNVEDFEGDPDADFGYNYVEGVTFFTDGDTAGNGGISGSELSDGFEMSSESDDRSFMGKGWAAPGTDYAKVVFRIEASAEGQASIFRAFFSFVDLTPDDTNNGFTTQTGSFSDTIYARFEEVGNDWQIEIVSSTNGDNPIAIGSAVVGFSPNSPHTFSFTVDTRGTGYVLIRDEDGNQVIKNETIGGSGYSGFQDLAGDVMYAQWFINQGDDTIINSYTFLDDSDDSPPNDEDSTCIFVDNGTQGAVDFTGDNGLTPPSISNFSSSSSSSSGSLGGAIFGPAVDGFAGAFGGSTTIGGIVVSILLILGFAVIGYDSLGGSLLGGGLGAVLGLVLAVSMTIFPLWPIVAAIVLAIGYLFLKFKGG